MKMSLILKISFVGPTNTRDARIKVSSPLQKWSVTFPWDYNEGASSISQITAKLAAVGIVPAAVGEFGPVDIIAVPFVENLKSVLEAAK